MELPAPHLGVGTGLAALCVGCRHVRNRRMGDRPRVWSRRILEEQAGAGNAVGFLFHSALLVPYFAWQRSHAVHHAKTNHLSQGETHVPKRADRDSGQKALALRKRLGRRGYGVYNLGAHLLVGWPIYLISGATPSDGDGRTNHFWPWKPFTNKLFPARFTRRVHRVNRRRPRDGCASRLVGRGDQPDARTSRST